MQTEAADETVGAPTGLSVPAWFRVPEHTAGEVEALAELRAQMDREAAAAAVLVARVARLHRDLLDGVATALRHLDAPGDTGPVRAALCAVIGYDPAAEGTPRALADLLWNADVFPGQVRP